MSAKRQYLRTAIRQQAQLMHTQEGHEKVCVDPGLWQHIQEALAESDELKPCRSPYCECSKGECSHPGCYDARGEEVPSQTPADFGDEFLSKRLARVAKLVGVTMPEGTHQQTAELAGTILGNIAFKLEKNQNSMKADAENYGEHLNEAAWAAYHEWNAKQVGPMTVTLYNNLKALVRAAILKYLDGMPQQTAAQHPDDLAVDKFAEAMKSKMAKARAKGRGGWDDAKQCTAEGLQTMLVEHLAKGDPVDVGNFAMMLWNRGESTAATEKIAVQNICIECDNADSWGMPDKLACKRCVSNSEWKPLNVSSKNPMKGQS